MLKQIETLKDRADGAVDTTRDAVVRGANSAERRVERTAEAVVDGTHAAASRVREGAQTASKAAHARVEGAARALDRGLRRSRQLAASAEDYVAENPGRALLMAAGVGFLLGWFVSRRRRSA